MKTAVNWRVFFILLSLSLLNVLAIFPYILTLQGELLRQTGIPISTILIVQLVQSAALFSIAIFLGLLLLKKLKHPIPLIDIKTVQDNWLLSVLAGITTAVIIYVSDYVFTLQGSAISTSQSIAPVWQKLLAAFYGGITEEVLMRLFLMTLFIWIGTKVTKHTQPTQTIIIISIIIAAIIFGLGHLPITASLTKITPIIILRAVILNGIGGIIFGWLYWKKGLESAMLAHFTTDIFLLTILTLLFQY